MHPRVSRRLALATGSVAMLVGPQLAKAVFLDFNSASTDFTNNFYVNHDSQVPGQTFNAGTNGPGPQAGNFPYSATAGINDNGGSPGGGVLANNIDMNSNYVGSGGTGN